MDVSPELQRNAQWRMAVSALRVGYVGLVVGIAGLVVLAFGSTPWVLGVGVIIWLAAAVVTVVGVFRARQEHSEPRPGFWRLRWMIIYETVHARPRAQQS